MKGRRVFVLVLVLVGAALLFSACGNHISTGQSLEHQQQLQDQTALETAQPLPHFNYSQERQNLKEIETAEANGVQTTSFFFNLGEPNPIQVCPSIGAPIPASAELSNPDQIIRDNQLNNAGGNLVISQMDPQGVYTGDTTGTYVLCIGADGKSYADYWEGYVQTVFGPAKWNSTTHSIEMVGPPSYAFTTSKTG